MNNLSLLLFLLNIIFIFSADKEEESKPEIEIMSDKEFIKIMNSGDRVIANSDVHLKMHELSQKAI